MWRATSLGRLTTRFADNGISSNMRKGFDYDDSSDRHIVASRRLRRCSSARLLPGHGIVPCRMCPPHLPARRSDETTSPPQLGFSQFPCRLGSMRLAPSAPELRRAMRLSGIVQNIRGLWSPVSFGRISLIEYWSMSVNRLQVSGRGYGLQLGRGKSSYRFRHVAPWTNPRTSKHNDHLP